jgi:lipopolysaccharide transport system permease protein
MEHVITARADGVARHLNPVTLARNLWRHRDLIGQFTRREVEGRYRGSFLGLFWSFVNPLVLLLIYTFVFGVIFKARWPQAKTDNLGEFAVTIFCGLTAFSIFSECVSRAPTIIVNVPNYVKKVVFPLEILPVSVLGSALFHGLISLVILLAANLLVTGAIQMTLVLLPLVALPLIFLSLGLTWFLASLGVFIRDIGYTIAIVVQVLFFITPIFYAPQLIPEGLRPILHLNPLASVVDNFRRVILFGITPVWTSLSLWILCTGVLMMLGYAFFMKTKKAFADVI